MTDHLLYNCLESETVEVKTNEVLDQIKSEIKHFKSGLSVKTTDKRTALEMEQQKNNPNTKEFKCEVCQKTFYYTPMQVLRHKNSHKT